MFVWELLFCVDVQLLITTHWKDLPSPHHVAGYLCHTPVHVRLSMWAARGQSVLWSFGPNTVTSEQGLPLGSVRPPVSLFSELLPLLSVLFCPYSFQNLYTRLFKNAPRGFCVGSPRICRPLGGELTSLQSGNVSSPSVFGWHTEFYAFSLRSPWFWCSKLSGFF